MDFDALREEPEEKDDSGLKKGPFSKNEKKFIRDNYLSMSDKAIADEFGRDARSVENWRQKNGFDKKGREVRKPQSPRKSKRKYVDALDDESKEKFYLLELRRSPLYMALVRAFRKSAEKKHFIKIYEAKFVEFMMDPTIETMTAMERDIWHEMTLAQVREMDYLRRENEKEIRYTNDGAEYETTPDFAREIAQCQDTVRKCQESLNVERRQRLKNSNDQAINFTEVIKELRSAATRRSAGDEAAMLRYIAHRHYNDHLGENILSGSEDKFDLGAQFKEGKEPEFTGTVFADGKKEKTDGDFTGEKALEEERQEALIGITGEEETANEE